MHRAYRYRMLLAPPPSQGRGLGALGLAALQGGARDDRPKDP
jgi:hypothetical protein